MKIIQVIPAFRLAGAEIMCENLCVALKKAGETVIAVSLYSEQTAITERLGKNGIRIVFLEKKPGFDPTIFVKLVKLFKEERPDVVHTHIYASKYALPAAVMVGVKRRVHTVHNMAQKEQGSLGRKINTFMYRHCDVVPVALSKEVRNSISRVYKIPLKKIPVIYNGIDLTKCIPKDSYDVDEKYKILHIGRFNGQKNHRMLIEAFNEFIKGYPNSELTLIGGGELEIEIKRLVKSLGLTDKVKFEGVTSDVFPYLHKADVFVLPSNYEGMPMALIEAMGTGLPIIATDVGGVSSMIHTGEDGILIGNDKSELKRAFILLLDKNLRKKIGLKAINTAKTKFSVAVMGRKYMALYSR